MVNLLLLPISTVVTFCSVGLKGFQHKNVIANKQKSVFYTSFLMAAIDYAGIKIVIEGNWSVAISAGVGAACGMIFAMRLHDRIFK